MNSLWVHGPMNLLDIEQCNAYTSPGCLQKTFIKQNPKSPQTVKETVKHILYKVPTSDVPLHLSPVIGLIVKPING